MNTKLLNSQELSEIASAIKPKSTHEMLSDALVTQYPNYEWNHIATREGYCSEGVADSDNNILTMDRSKWIENQLTHSNSNSVWRNARDSGLRTIEYWSKKLMYSARYGHGLDEYAQVSFFVTDEAYCRELFLADPLIDRGTTVLDHSGCQIGKLTTFKHYYQFNQIELVKRKLWEVGKLHLNTQTDMSISSRALLKKGNYGHARVIPPAIRQRSIAQSKEQRFFHDWGRTCGYGGHKIERHWWFDFWQQSQVSGVSDYGFIPQWADGDGGLDLPTIDHTDTGKGPSYLLRKLKEFDDQTGYEFSWFFYMVHGNRIRPCAGEYVTKLVQQGHEPYSTPNQRKVLKEWGEHQYGF